MFEIINTIGLIVALFGIIFLFYLVFKMHIRTNEIDKNLTKLTREIAIRRGKIKK